MTIEIIYIVNIFILTHLLIYITFHHHITFIVFHFTITLSFVSYIIVDMIIFTHIVIAIATLKGIIKIIKIIKIIDVNKIIKIKKTIIKSRDHHVIFVPETFPKSNTSQSFKTVTSNVIEEISSFFFDINLLNNLNEKEIVYNLSKRRIHQL